MRLPHRSPTTRSSAATGSPPFSASRTEASGSLVYAGDGDARLPKERVEAFGGGLSAVIDDFKRLELYRGGRRSVVKQAQDKGHRAEIALFVAAAAGREQPPSPESYLASTRATLALAESLRTGLPVEL